MAGSKLDALFQQARRSSGQKRATQVSDEDRKRSGGDDPKVHKAKDSDRLILTEGRDGRMRYYLDGEEVRVGDPIEVYINDANGWIYGSFQWTGRERHAPSVRVELRAPEESGSFVGNMDATLPKHARVRRP